MNSILRTSRVKSALAAVLLDENAATQAEVNTGTETAKYVSPATLQGRVDTDGTLAANSDVKIPSQKAVKTYVDAYGGGKWSLATGGALTGNNTITGNYSVDFQNDGIIITGVNGSSSTPLKIKVTTSASNIFNQTWENKSGDIRMSFGDISTIDSSPALKICALSRSQNVELALVQNVGSANARDYGGFFDIQPTTSDLTWTRRVNLVDTEALRIANSDGTVTIPGKVTMTSANGANLTLSQNNSTNFTVSNINSGASASAGVVITGQNGSLNISKYSSAVTPYKVLSANGGNFYNSNGNMNFLSDAAASSINFAAGGASANHFGIDGSGNVVMGSAAIATTATDGFLYIVSCAGAPTGVPTAKTGRVPIIYDSSNDFLYIYNGGWKKSTVYA